MDELYNWILFGHIIGAAIWFGGAVAYEGLGGVAKRTGKASEYTRYIYTAMKTSGVIMPIAAFMTLGFGIWLVVQSNDVWSFSDTFISIGFAAAIIGIGLGVFMMMPQGKKLAALVEANGFDDPEAGAIARKIGMADHFQTLIVTIAMVAMVFKF
ncbi:MAG: hypothetical protein DWP92_09405 [Armatimonadetes bacterium]|nr:MAG: hypothetical protein DWP92_09405 [Armatimonadota bacterium]